MFLREQSVHSVSRQHVSTPKLGFFVILAVLFLTVSAFAVQDTAAAPARKPAGQGTRAGAARKAQGSKAAPKKSSSEEDAAKIQQLMPDFIALLSKLQAIQFPPLRSQSHLLPLLPDTTQFFVSLPNLGDPAQQARSIFDQQLKESPALRESWQSLQKGGNGPSIDDALDKIHQIFDYLGDEVVIGMSFQGKDAKNITGMLIAEVKKPGLREAVEKLGADLKNKDLMIFTPEQLMAAKGDGPNGRLTGKNLVLIRPDFVACSDNLPALQHLNESLNSGGGHFDTSAFGQRLERAYQGGAGFLSGLDLHYLVNEVSPKTEKETAALQQSGFGDVKYLIAEHKQVSGQSTNRSEISFNGPRHGVASWLGQPGTMGGLDFVPADSIMAVSLLLKSPAEIFDDLKSLAEASQPGSSQKLDQMQTAFNLNLRDDLLGKLTGEITYAVQDMSGPDSAWTIALKTNDPAGLQKTIERLVAFVGMTAGSNGNAPTIGHETENGITYNTVQVPNPQKPMEISYASVDGYLLIGSGKARLMDAVRLHQSGRSLAKVGGLGALLPQDVHGVSAILYQTKSPFLKYMLAGMAPGLAQSPVFDQSTPTAVWARGDESAISFGSNNPGFDLGMVSVIAAIAIPNMMRAKSIATEGTAAPAVHKTRPAAAHKPH